MKYFLITYGCQMNKSDSERITAVLENKGYKPAQKIDGADLIVVNMCSVRQSAVDRVHGLLPKIKNLPAGRRTILTGCILKKDRRKLSEEFDEVVEIKDLIKDIEPEYSNNFSAFVPIMRGCNNFCAYCVVPYTRGGETSRPAEEIICEIKRLIKQGFKEIWLLGQNVNSYSNISFPQLLRKVNDIPGEFWIRFTSSHPKDFSDEFIDAMTKCQKVTKYLNLPVQAGNDEILKKMNRPYTITQYKKIISKIKREIPNITLSTDVIVGFPGETKKQFNNTAKLFKEIKYDMAYIAKYSPRAGTAAAKLKDNVPQKEKHRREKVLTEILKQTALENNKKYIGKTIEVLPTNYKDKFLVGKSFHYKTVKFKGQKNLIGKITKVKITDALPWGLKGE
ncbi:MiaB/RimO family radical SAM methylthiotransferase [Patescibacteria group bacterium]|nr:MiaB/RimO family radical SAM methylthiotransferase [Patescibacteria group bacterium]